MKENEKYIAIIHNENKTLQKHFANKKKEKMHKMQTPQNSYKYLHSPSRTGDERTNKHTAEEKKKRRNISVFVDIAPPYNLKMKLNNTIFQHNEKSRETK